MGFLANIGSALLGQRHGLFFGQGPVVSIKEECEFVKQEWILNDDHEKKEWDAVQYRKCVLAAHDLDATTEVHPC